MEAAANGFISNDVISDRHSFPSSDANTFCGKGKIKILNEDNNRQIYLQETIKH
jgi:hypothetical protein